MPTRIFRNATTIALAGALAVFAAGCDDPLEPEEHPEAGGVVILQAGTETVLATSVGTGTAFDNPITVPLGGALEVEILFLNQDALTDISRAFGPDADEGESLRVTIVDESIVGFDLHGDHGDFEGLAAGSTTATFDLMHGSHSDFRSGELTIVVQ